MQKTEIKPAYIENNFDLEYHELRKGLIYSIKDRIKNNS